MSTTDEARAEAQRRYPKRPFVAESHVQNSFIAGAVWQASRTPQPGTVTEAQVEAGGRALHRLVERGTPWEDTTQRQKMLRFEEARAVLDAARLTPAQPVQVEVTDDMRNRAVNAVYDLGEVGNNYIPEYQANLIYEVVDAVLSAALGGGTND